MRFRRLALFALPAAATLGTLGAAIPAQAANAVVVNRHCSQTSLTTLEVQREDTGRLSIDFSVDMARHTPGVTWRIKESNNGTRFSYTSKRTIADGSFSLTRIVNPQPGTNRIVARATNPTTSETCLIAATI